MLSGLGVAAALWLVVVTRSFAELHASNCVSPSGPSEIVRANLTQIMAALYTYANANDEAFPPRLSMLYPELISNPAVFWNPGDSDPCPTTIDNDDLNGINSDQVSFRYIGGSAADAPFLVVHDHSTSNNGGLGVHAAISSRGGISFLAPTMSPPSFTAAARANLEAIGAALRSYAEDHEGHYPPALSKLYPAYIATPAVFCNPGDTVGPGSVPPATINNDTPNQANSAQISFQYMAAGQNLWELSADAVLLRENQTGLGGRQVALEARANGIYSMPIHQLTQLTISGPDAVAEGHAANFACLATFDDGTIQDVTLSEHCHWLVSNGQGAFVLRGQYLATPLMPNDTSVTIEAIYYGGSTSEQQTSKTITVLADADADGVEDSKDQCPCTIAGAAVDAFGCPALVFGDADGDGDVDTADLDTFVACVSGPTVPARAGCKAFDRDRDSDVDQSDFGYLQQCYSGTGRPGNPNCAG